MQLQTQLINNILEILSAFSGINSFFLSLKAFPYMKFHREGWKRMGKQDNESLTIKDLAYLSAATHHEFALLRGKTKDIVFHGTDRHCKFDEELLTLLKIKKLRLIAHTHPDFDSIKPSADDRDFLKYIEQSKSIIISYITGYTMEFTNNIFDDYTKGSD